MKIIAFGQTGQVSRELGLRGVQTMGRDRADLTDPAACAALIEATDCDAVINAAAYTAVDRAEDEEHLAQQINADAPGAMARACAAKGVPFVHYSTDYVFAGTGTRPYSPSDATAPTGAYGRTKLAGENAVLAAGGRSAIIRTSWVFSAHGGNFVKTMLRLGAERDHVRVVDDQIGGPTPAAAIAEVGIAAAKTLAADPDAAGLYHFSGAPDASWADFAAAIMAEAGLDCRVDRIPSSEYPTAATRPLNSRLDCTATEQAFGVPRPDWHDGLRAVLAALN